MSLRALRSLNSTLIPALLFCGAAAGPAMAEPGTAAPLASASGDPVAGAGACGEPALTAAPGVALPQVRARLQAAQPLAILVASATKASSRSSKSGYATRLAAELGGHLPGRVIRVAVLNIPGEPAPAMVKPLLKAVAEQRPALVIWQTGAVDAARNLDPGIFAQAVNDGIAAVRRLGADVIVMDMQYGPRPDQPVDVAPYVTNLAWVSRSNGVLHFPRHDVTQRWAETGILDTSAAGSGTGGAKDASFDFVHGCLARLVADAIASLLRS